MGEDANQEAVDVNHIHPLEDFVKQGLDYLPSYVLGDKANFKRLLEILIERLQVIDEKMVELAELRTTLKATDENLDEIGRQLGIYRNGLNDTEYRAVIMILTGNNAKSGTRGDVISTLKQIFGDEGVTTYKGENYRLDINIFNTCVKVTDILPQILDMLPLVTHLRVVENTGYPFGFFGDAQSFGFSSIHDAPPTNDVGGMSTLLYVSDDEESWFN